MSTINPATKAVKPKAPKIEELIQSNKSLILATLDAEGNPAASYAPFVHLDGTFQILVSFMAKHTRNLRDRKKVSVMLIEDEASVKQIYARDRLTLDCEVIQVDPETDLWNRAVEELKNRHGKVIDVLSGLNDFIMFDLQPTKGSYVNGFGSAYSVNPDLTVNEHVKGAHGKAEAPEAK
ncbi:MAG: pyridoxamine 5'-phosphate oxidase family protein [Moheibacter sp.]